MSVSNFSRSVHLRRDACECSTRWILCYKSSFKANARIWLAHLSVSVLMDSVEMAKTVMTSMNALSGHMVAIIQRSSSIFKLYHIYWIILKQLDIKIVISCEWSMLALKLWVRVKSNLTNLLKRFKKLNRKHIEKY